MSDLDQQQDQRPPTGQEPFTGHNRRKLAVMVCSIVAGGLLINTALAAVLVPRAGVVLDALSASTSSDGLVPGEQVFDNQDFSHVEGDVTYPQTPSAGGPHAPVWLNCGVYASEVPEENATHSLEHGAVWITYDPSLPADEVQQLREVAQYETYVILSPYAGQAAPVMLSAWNHQIQLDSASDERVSQFVSAYVQGPQTPEPGAPCFGGLDPVGLGI